jgi:beta-glucosidase
VHCYIDIMKKQLLSTYVFLFCGLILFAASSFAQKVLPYKDSTLPIDQRVEDLLARMTLKEKFWQMFLIPGDLSDGKERYKEGIFGFQVAARPQSDNASGQMLSYDAGSNGAETARLINKIQEFLMKETRLGIPMIPVDEALHGLVREGATSFPQSIALAATFDTVLMAKIGGAVAKEVKTRGLRDILSPVINLATDVRWGRTEETYGEDPVLSAMIGVSYIRQFEKYGIITTPKHFVANSGDGGRDSYPIHSSEMALEEGVLYPFKEAFLNAGSRSVMTSYNSLNGAPCTANNWLLNKKLKEEWGFKGFVISDAGATGGANVLHFTAADYAESARNAVENGLDVFFQGSYDHYPLFWKPFETGMISQKAIDNAVRRILRAKFELGLFENPYVDPEQAKIWNNHPSHRALALKAAEEALVLLKNDKDVLPISANIKSIAIIGKDAEEARLGGYSGPGVNNVSILDGIKKITAGKVKISYTAGGERKTDSFSNVPSEYLSCIINGKTEQGVLGEYFDNPKFEGEPIMSRKDGSIAFGWTLFSPNPKIPYDWFSARWAGKLKAPRTGKIQIGVRGNDGYRLYLNHRLVVDCWIKQSFGTHTVSYDFEQGKEYDIRLEYFETAGNARLKLVWDAFDNEAVLKKNIADAVDLARNSDLAIVVAGINEGEFSDRAMLTLPGNQEELIKEVAKTGKPVVVLLVGGSAITMSEWMDSVAGIMTVWYPGEEGGNAVAKVLLGEVSPSGRTPITWPLNEAQLPLVYNHKPTGRGDDYNNLSGQPLFPFGFGLSYTTFEYSGLTLEKREIKSNESVLVTFKVKNTGKYAGDEVVQLYIRDVLASVSQPVVALKDFQRVHLKPGETQTLSFKITPKMLSLLNTDMKSVVEPGDFRLLIGASSKDIRLRGIIAVK